MPKESQIPKDIDALPVSEYIKTSLVELLEAKGRVHDARLPLLYRVAQISTTPGNTPAEAAELDTLIEVRAKLEAIQGEIQSLRDKLKAIILQ